MEWVQSAELQRAFVARVYRWMFLGLSITAFVAYAVTTNPDLLQALWANRMLRMGLWLGELGLVVALAGAAHRLSGRAAAGLFFLYAALNGLSFSVLFAVVAPDSIAQAFLLTAGTFGVMSVYGTVTRKDLSSWGSFLFMGLVGVILAGVVNLFVHSSMASFVISCATVVVFTGLTAYDTQKLRAMAGQLDGNPQAASLSVAGALELYLDFINLFLAILRLTGKRR